MARATKFAARDMAQQQRIEAAQREAQEAARDCRCPKCGRPVRRNLALSYWIQCSQFGAPNFRADPQSPKCSWQGFTA